MLVLAEKEVSSHGRRGVRILSLADIHLIDCVKLLRHTGLGMQWGEQPRSCAPAASALGRPPAQAQPARSTPGSGPEASGACPSSGAGGASAARTSACPHCRPGCPSATPIRYVMFESGRHHSLNLVRTPKSTWDTRADDHGCSAPAQGCVSVGCWEHDI